MNVVAIATQSCWEKLLHYRYELKQTSPAKHPTVQSLLHTYLARTIKRHVPRQAVENLRADLRQEALPGAEQATKIVPYYR